MPDMLMTLPMETNYEITQMVRKDVQWRMPSARVMEESPLGSLKKPEEKFEKKIGGSEESQYMKEKFRCCGPWQRCWLGDQRGGVTGTLE